MQQIGQSNPALLQLISQNQDAFYRMLAESSPSARRGTGPGGVRAAEESLGEEQEGADDVLYVTAQDKEAIDRVLHFLFKFFNYLFLNILTYCYSI